MHIKHTKSS